MGRVLVVNSLVESLLVYRFTVLPVGNHETEEEIQKLITSFVWRARRPKIAHTVLKLDKNMVVLGYAMLT